MRFARFFGLLGLILAATACGPLYETTYEFSAPRSAEGRVCTSQCLNWQQSCTHACQRDEENCKNRARDEARYEYRRYVDEMNRTKQKVKKTESSFYRAYQCGSSSCKDDCSENYRQCFVSCGGAVTPRTVCTAFCDEAKPGTMPSSPPSSPLSSPSSALPSPPRDRSEDLRGAESGQCQPGRLVEVLWEGEWFPAKVLRTAGSGRCLIHYEGYGSEDDEAVSLRRIRARP